MTQDEADSFRDMLLMHHHPDHAIDPEQMQSKTILCQEILDEYKFFTRAKKELETYNPQKVVEKPVFVAIQRKQEPFDLADKLRSFVTNVAKDPAVLFATFQEVNSVLNTVSALMNPKKPKGRKRQTTDGKQD